LKGFVFTISIPSNLRRLFISIFPISCVSGENPGKKSGHFPISCVSGENPGKKSKKSGHFYEEPPVKLGFL
jgi:hypothetical protein